MYDRASGAATPRLLLTLTGLGLIALVGLSCEEALVFDEPEGFADIGLEAEAVPDTVVVGQQSVARAAMVDSVTGGHVIEGPAIQWSTSNPNVIQITSSAAGDSIHFQAIGPGTATITARVDSLPYRTESVTHNLTVVLADVAVENGDTTLTALHDTIVVRGTGLGIAAPVEDAGITWLIRGSGALQRIGTGPADEIRVEAVATGTDTIEVTHELCLADCVDQIEVVVTQVPVTVTAALTGVQIDALGVDTQLVATVRDRRGFPIPGALVTWASANAADSAVASLSSSGLLVSRGNGAAGAVASHAALADTVAVTVAQVPVSIAVAPDSMDFVALAVDSTATAIVRDRNDSTVAAAVVTWTTGNGGVADVDAGVVTSIGSGATSVVASVGSLSDSVTVRVMQVVIDVELAADTVLFTALDDVTDLDATGYDVNVQAAPGLPTDWVSRDNDVAAVDGTGTVTAQGVGETWIVATIEGVSDSAFVSVSQLVDSVDVQPDSILFDALGDTRPLSIDVLDRNRNDIAGTSASCVSRDGAVASYGAIGGVRAEADGDTRIVCDVEGVRDSVLVRVDQVAVQLAVTPQSLLFTAFGESTVLTIEGAVDAGGSPVEGDTTWVSLDTTVATVSARGRVRPRGYGSTSVIGSMDGVADTVEVQVVQVIASVELAVDTVALDAIDDTATVGYTATDRNGDVVPGAALAWDSRDEAIATVDANGRVTAVAVGETWVAATAGDGVDSVLVRVVQVVVRVEAEPDSVTFTYLGATLAPTISAYDANDHVVAQAAAWTSRDVVVASWGGDSIRAAADGETWLVGTIGGVSDSIHVTVDQVVVTLAVLPDSVRFTEFGATEPLTVVNALDAGGSPATGDTTWVARDENVASVSTSGVVSAVAFGSTWVVATIDGASDSAQIHVVQAVATLTLDVDTLALTALADTATIGFTAVDDNGDDVPNAQPDWVSRDTTVATVDAAGRVTAVAVGSTWIDASIDDGRDSVFVDVSQVVTAVDIAPAPIQFAALDDSVQATGQPRDANGFDVPAGVTWTTRVDAIASVSAGGMVRAVGPGSTWLVASAGGYSDSVAVIVSQVIADVVMAGSITDFTRATDRDSVTLAAYDANGFAVTGRVLDVDWSVAPAGVVSLAIAPADSLGALVAPVRFGQATLSATIEGVSDERVLTVTPTYLEVAPRLDTIAAIGATSQLSATLSDADSVALPGAIAWSVRDGSVAQVSTSGLVTAVANGATWVLATHGALIDSALVVVDQRVTSIEVTPTSASVVAGGTQTYTARAEDAAGMPVPNALIVWSSSNEAIATVAAANDTQAVATATGFGSATITATVGNVSGNASFTANPFAPTACSAPGGTSHNGTIVTSETWDSIGNPHRVTAEFSVQGAAVLTIQPGTLVCVSQNVAMRFQLGGRLNARGTAAKPILFTRNSVSGTWGGLNFSGAPAQASTLRHSWIENSVLTTSESHVLNADTIVVQNTPSSAVFGATLGSRRSRLTASQISGGNIGVYIPADSVTVADVEISGTAQSAVRTDNATRGLVLRRLRALNNTGAGIHLNGLQGGTLDTVLIQTTGGAGIMGGATGVTFRSVRVIDAGTTGLDIVSYGLTSASGVRVQGSGGYGIVTGIQALAMIAPTLAAYDSLRGNANDSIRIFGGTMTAGQTLHLDTTMHWSVGSSFTVGGGTLTIHPGVDLAFPGTMGAVFTGGRLLALGTAAHPITFRPSNPAAPWGGFNFQGTPGDTSRISWATFTGVNDATGAVRTSQSHPVVIEDSRIRQSTLSALSLNSAGSRFVRSSVDTTHSSTNVAVTLGSNVTLEDVVVRAAGGNGVQVDGTDVNLDHVRIEESGLIGLSTAAGATFIRDVAPRVINSGTYAARVSLPVLADLDQDSLFGNGIDSLLISGGTLTNDTVIGRGDLGWRVEAGFNVGSGGRLVLAPGTRIEVPLNTRIDVVSGGMLDARGTAALPITFTTADASWLGIVFDGLNADTTRLTNVLFEKTSGNYSAYGSAGAGYVGVVIGGRHRAVLDSVRIRQSSSSALGIMSRGVRVHHTTIDTTLTAVPAVLVGDSTDVVLEDVTVRGSAGDGLLAFGQNMTLDGVRVESATGVGMRMSLSPSFATGIRIVGGDTIPAALTWNALARIAPTPALQDSLTGNADDRLEMSGSLSGDTVHLGSALEYQVLSLTATGGSLMTLDPGVTLRMSPAVGAVTFTDSRLLAIGTAADSIRVVPLTGASWAGGIAFNGATTDTSRLVNVRVEGAGGIAGGFGQSFPTSYASITVGNRHLLSMDSVSIVRSGAGAIGIVSRGARLSNVLIDSTENHPALLVTDSTDIRLEDVTIRAAGADGLLAYAPGMTIDGLRIEGSGGVGMRMFPTPSFASGIRITGGDTIPAALTWNVLARIAPTPALQDSLVGNEDDWLLMSGAMSADTVHLGSALDYEIDGLTATAGSRITIDPGVSIWSGPGAAGFYFSDSNLLALGTSTNPIRFGPRTGSSWSGGLHFNGVTTDTSRLVNVTVSNASGTYGGFGSAGSTYGAVVVGGSHRLSLDTVTIRQSANAALGIISRGVRVANTTIDTTLSPGIPAVLVGDSAGVVLEGLTIRDAAGDGLLAYAPDMTLDGVRIEGAAGVGMRMFQTPALANGIRIVDGDTIPASLTWNVLARIAPTPALQDSLAGNEDDWLEMSGTLTGDTVQLGSALDYEIVSLTAGGNALLTIDPGVDLWATNGIRIDVNDANLIAQGTEAERIRFAPRAGSSWQGLHLGGTPADTSRLMNVTISSTSGIQGYFGTAGYSFAGVIVAQNHRVAMDSVTIRQSATGALGVIAPDFKLRHSTIDTASTANSYAALIVADSSGAVIEDVVIRNATSFGLIAYGPGMIMDGVRIEGSGGVGLRLGTIAGAVTGCTIEGSGSYGIELIDQGSITTSINGCNILNNVAAGVHNPGVQILNAENNWWGDPAGPTGPAGDGVSGNVDYDPFLTSPAP